MWRRRIHQYCAAAGGNHPEIAAEARITGERQYFTVRPTVRGKKGGRGRWWNH
jgi:hypothetical protein